MEGKSALIMLGRDVSSVKSKRGVSTVHAGKGSQLTRYWNRLPKLVSHSMTKCVQSYSGMDMEICHVDMVKF